MRDERIQRYKTFLEEADDTDLASSALRKHVLRGQPSQQKSAAETLLKNEERKEADEGVRRWAQIMMDIGADVVLPINPGDMDVTCSFEDLISGRGYVRLGLPARLRLLERAGAPWNVMDPEAQLSDLQREILEREERIVILHGGSGVGKSVLGGCLGLLQVSLPNQKIAVVGATYDHAANEFEYIHQGFLQLYGEDKACAMSIAYINRNSYHSMEIKTLWNSQVEVFSTDRDEGSALLGKEFDLIIYGEGSKVRSDVHQRKAVRALNRRVKTLKSGYYRKTGRAFMCTTPDGFAGAASEEWDRVIKATKNRPHELHCDAAPSWLETIYLREAAAIENPAYSKEAFEAAEKLLPADIFAEQFLGRRVRRSGLIYQEFDPDKHVVPMLNTEDLRRMRFSVSFDTGKHFSCGLRGLTPDSTLYRLGEVVTKELSIYESARMVKKLVTEILGPVVGSQDWNRVKSRVDLWPCDPRSQSKRELMEALDIPLSDAKMEVLGSIDQLRQMMKENRFFVVEGHNAPTEAGEGFLWEISRYSWRVVRAGTSGASVKAQFEPVKVDDHSMDEERYGAISLLELGPPPAEEHGPHLGFRERMNQQQGIRGLAAQMKAQFAKQSQPRPFIEGWRNVHG